MSDFAENWADRLANRISEITGIDIGEHSNLNNPWEEALDALDELASAPSGWRPIAEAPRDGTPVDLWTPNRRFTDMRWSPDYKMWGSTRGDWLHEHEPTHFMPLPPAPQQGEIPKKERLENAMQRLFMGWDDEATQEQLEEQLREDGVDVEAFKKRLAETVEQGLKSSRERADRSREKTSGAPQQGGEEEG